MAYDSAYKTQIIYLLQHLLTEGLNFDGFFAGRKEEVGENKKEEKGGKREINKWICISYSWVNTFKIH